MATINKFPNKIPAKPNHTICWECGKSYYPRSPWQYCRDCMRVLHPELEKFRNKPTDASRKKANERYHAKRKAFLEQQALIKKQNEDQLQNLGASAKE